MPTLDDVTLDGVQALRTKIEAELATAPSVCIGAERFVRAFTTTFDSIALARLFLLAPFEILPEAERTLVETGRTEPLPRGASVLTLLGTSGKEPAWNHRETSAGHRVIPLVDRTAIQAAPMLAALLEAMKVDVDKSDRSGVQLRALGGGLNARFYVADARSTLDKQGRHIIAAQDFVKAHGIRTVFGMGGTYVGKQLAVAILFTRELLTEARIDMFPSLISTFKMATSGQMAAGRVF